MYNHTHMQRIAAKDLERFFDAIDTVNKIIFQQDRANGVAAGVTKKEGESVYCTIFYNETAHVCSLFYYFGAKVAEAEKDGNK